MKEKALIFICILLGAISLTEWVYAQRDSASTTHRTVTPVADGIYMIRHKDSPDGFPQGNTTVIIGEREVFIVDACYLPSSAKEDIAQIRQWTDKPVRYLLNTHWHGDHTHGNETYADAFPSISIVAHVETRKQLEGYYPGVFERFPTRAATFRQVIESGKDPNGRTLNADEIKAYKEALAGLEPVSEEFKKIRLRLPDITFDSQLTLDIGNREIQIQYLGRGNTAGDAVVYLPGEKILIAGDLVDHPVPYLGSGYPSEQVLTLRKMAALDVETIIPGHGNVLNGKSYLLLLTEFIQEVVTQVRKAVHRAGGGPRNLEAVRAAVHQNVNFAEWKKKFVGDNKEDGDFFESFSVQGVVTAAYAEIWGQ